MDLNFRIEAPAKVSLLVYDNNTFIVESFLPEGTKIRILANTPLSKLTDLVSGEQLNSNGKSSSYLWGRTASEKNYFDIVLKPHSFRVFKAE